LRICPPTRTRSAGWPARVRRFAGRLTTCRWCCPNPTRSAAAAQFDGRVLPTNRGGRRSSIKWHSFSRADEIANGRQLDQIPSPMVVVGRCAPGQPLQSWRDSPRSALSRVNHRLVGRGLEVQPENRQPEAGRSSPTGEKNSRAGFPPRRKFRVTFFFSRRRHHSYRSQRYSDATRASTTVPLRRFYRHWHDAVADNLVDRASPTTNRGGITLRIRRWPRGAARVFRSSSSRSHHHRALPARWGRWSYSSSATMQPCSGDLHAAVQTA